MPSSGDRMRFDIRPYRPGDEGAILASFNHVFRAVNGPGFVDRDLATWEWWYPQNPSGMRVWVAVAEDGTVAAHYGGIPYRVHTPVGDKVFVHAIDSYTHPAYRRGLKRPGLFVRTADAWFEDCRRRGDALVYGYPVAAAERIGAKYLGYSRVRIVDYLVRPLGDPAEAVPADVEVAEVGTLPAGVDALEEAVRREQRDEVATVRDRRYLHWRWLASPGSPYRVLLARRGASVCGLAVVHPRHELVPGAVGLADWLVPRADRGAADALLARAVEVGREAGRRVLLAVLADPSPEHAAFRDRGFFVRPSAEDLERRLGNRIFDPAIPADWLAARWWYTLGDSDLV